MIHLDTSFLIRALIAGSREDQQLRRWLKTKEPLSLSVICWTEFLCGPVQPNQVELTARLLPDPVPFLSEDSSNAAYLFNSSGRRRGSLIDCMIAAVAMRSAAALATANRDDFVRFQQAGLKLADINR